jgi:DUF4097 and DUF4098 domain-containing protein YvlB
MKKTAFTILVPICIFFIAASAMGKDINKDFQKSFEVKEGVTLRLEHGDGDVTITPWDKDVVDVEVHYRAETKSLGIGGKVYFDVEFKQSGDMIYVIEKEKRTASVGFHSFKRREYTYNVRAPRYVVLDLNGDDGNVEISDWRARIELVLEDGDIELENIVSPQIQIDLEDGDVTIRGLEGKLELDAEDGDVELRGCKIDRCRINLEDGDVSIRNSEGSFEIDVEDGEINLSELRAKLVDIRASDGDVDLDLLKVDDIDVDISTEDGDVTLRLQSGISAVFDVETDDGRIRVDLPNVENLREKKHRASGELFGGLGKIRIDTSDGSVTLRESD